MNTFLDNRTLVIKLVALHDVHSVLLVFFCLIYINNIIVENVLNSTFGPP